MDQAYLKQRLLYSPKSGVFYWISPPPAHSDLLGELAGSPTLCNGKAYWTITIDRVKYKRSRLAFLYITGAMPPDQIDHINGNSLDDRWQNLRPATATENAWNHKGRARKVNLPMGVRKNASSGRFSARIGVRGKQISLGSFDTPEEAHAVYLNARKQYFGEFA